MSLMEYVSRYLAYPLWDVKDRSHRLKEFKRLQKSQWHTPDQITAYQLERLKSIMEHAYTTVPFYRERWLRDPVKNPVQSVEELQDFPIVTKTDVREYQDQLISEKYKKSELVMSKTGGSTGVALELFFDKRCQEYRNAAAMMADGWAGWKPGMLVGALWGSPALPKTSKERLRSLIHDRAFYLDTMNLNPDSMTAFLREVVRRKPKALYGHAHSLYMLARFVEADGMKLQGIRSIVATSMMLLEPHRKVIEKVFGAKVTNRYGCEEVGLVGCECVIHDGFHLVDHTIVEVVDHSNNSITKETGRLLLSDLNNRGMPLIRYEVGDLGLMSGRRCECGMGLPIMKELSGRTADYLIRSDGGLVSGISLVEKTLTAVPGVLELQIVQNEIAEFTLFVVTAKNYDSDSEKCLKEIISKAFGSPVNVKTERRSILNQTASGKFRFAICELESPSYSKIAGG